MPKPDEQKPQPTIGPGDEVDEGAILFFLNWLPLRWKKRPQNPDIHIDYRVEMVEGGEPSGLHFQAQIKGRSIYKRKAKNVAEPIKKKHLRYYLRCEEPVFLFLIDPISKKGNWVFIQRYLKERVSDSVLKGQGKLSIKFDAQRSCEGTQRFEEELRQSWNYMRDLHPGSPIAAILLQKQRLEKLDPRFVVEISATSESQRIEVKPRKAMPQFPRVKFHDETGPGMLKEFYEKGNSFRIKASEIEIEDSPIHSAILRDLGDAEVTITDGREFKGCLQLTFGAENEQVTVQIDGEWQLAPRRQIFKGQLSESPLKIELTREQNETGEAGQAVIGIRYDWGAWERQALLSLAYFADLRKLVSSMEFSALCLVRGNRTGKAETFVVPPETRQKGADAFGWLQKCRLVAQHLGMNPPFPMRAAHSEIESNDTRVLVELLEDGKHEQSNAGMTSEFEADIPPGDEAPPQGAEQLEFPEPYRLLKFFGIDVPLGPLRHIWTDMQLASVAPLKGNRFKLAWKGGPTSTYRIVYDGPRLRCP